MTDIIVIAHNIRSTHNVGSIFRTCEGFGVKRIILSGYTPYPKTPTNNSGDKFISATNSNKSDARLPHIVEKLTAQIRKTALGAEELVPFEYQAEPDIQSLKDAGYRIVGLEQAPNSINITAYKAPKKIALILGEEVHGIPSDLLEMCQDIIEIPMKGKKESFNVSVAAAIALYQLSLA